MRILSRKKINSKELKVISSQLSSMLGSGCDIITCLEILITSSSRTVEEGVKRTLRSIKNGKTLAESFALSTYFTNFFVNMVRAGEISGKIDYVFNRMSFYYERQTKLKSKIIGACLYPIILLVVSIFSFVFMLVYVVPNFEQAFESYDGINMESISIFKLSRFIREYYLLLLILLTIGIIYLIKSISSSGEIKNYIDRLLFKLPRISKINQIYICDQFSRALSILIASGVNIEDSIDIATNTLESKYFHTKMNLAKSYIELGSPVSKALAKTGIFPQVFISMMLAGEESGSFDSSLVSISKYYEQELDRELENATRLIEPIMLVVMGIMIGSVLISILRPMFEMISSIS